MLLSKGLKSLQLSLNELIPKFKLSAVTATNMAYSKARRKLKNTAFIELNQRAVVDVIYSDNDYRTWHGLRLLAVDGSQIMLPTTDEMEETFGSVHYRNQLTTVTGSYCAGLASVLYDVLNRVVLNAQLKPLRTYEVDVAKEHLAHITVDDLVIYDRGYCSFRMLALASQANGHFLIRCHGKSFQAVNEMLAGNGPDDAIVTLSASKPIRTQLQAEGLPETLTVRLVRVTLETGEYEVLATSLVDRACYPSGCFRKLYWLRWGIETFYGTLKTRLGLENFSGYSPEAVRQDFFAIVFLSGMESIFTADAEKTLRRQRGGHPKKVNKAVSFNTIKYRAFELFMSHEPVDVVLAELDALFLQSPTLVRKDRHSLRKPHPAKEVLPFYKRRRKIVY